jgi:RHS repeat-associated protein
LHYNKIILRGFMKAVVFNYEDKNLISRKDTNLNYKFTGQERDSYTNYDYMHFRYYSSSIGRFLKPDNVIQNVYNPQSWNLYCYVHNNPVNFNDPLGHYCKVAMTSQILFAPGGALGLSPAYGGMWEDPQGKGTMAPFAEAGSVSGYWQPVYGQAAYTSGGESVWDTELGAWVGPEMTITSQVVGWQFVSEMSGGVNGVNQSTDQVTIAMAQPMPLDRFSWVPKYSQALQMLAGAEMVEVGAALSIVGALSIAGGGPLLIPAAAPVFAGGVILQAGGIAIFLDALGYPQMLYKIKQWGH